MIFCLAACNILKRKIAASEVSDKPKNYNLQKIKKQVLKIYLSI